MNNLFFCPEKTAIHEKYDIKGSTFARSSTPPMNGQTCTCRHCEQKFVYEVKKKGHKKMRMSSSISGGYNLFNRNSILEAIENLAFGGPAVSNPMNPRSGPSLTPDSHSPGSSRSKSMASVDQHDISQIEGDDSSTASSDRCAVTVSGEHEPNVVLKDNDLKYKFRLPKSVARQVQAQLENDANFLHSIGVMDYSLLGRWL
jgi:hypothetical protein